MKTIFITGGTSGIGKATAELFAKNGWYVIAAARRPERGEDLLKYDNVELLKIDLTDPQMISKTCSEVMQKYDVDVLFNNAGSGLITPFEKASLDEIKRLFDTDVIGPILVTREFVPYFKEKKSGMIITNTSIAGVIATPLNSIYAAAKAALLKMSEVLYYELKPFGISVKTIIPGAVETDFQYRLELDDDYKDVFMKQNAYMLGESHAQATPEDTAKTVYEAATDELDKVHYPSEEQSKKLYEDYISVPFEEFKEKLSDIIY